MSIKMTAKDDRATLAIQGRFDFKLHGDFRRYSEEALANPAIKTIDVSLRDVEYLDSSALGMLLLLREKASHAGHREVTLSGAVGMVQQVLDVANFHRLFTID